MLKYIYAHWLCCSCKMHHNLVQERCEGIFEMIVPDFFFFQRYTFLWNTYIHFFSSSSFTLNKYLNILFENPAHTNQNVPKNLYFGNIWCILLEQQSHNAWISLTCSTELKSSFPFGSHGPSTATNTGLPSYLYRPSTPTVIR